MSETQEPQGVTTGFGKLLLLSAAVLLAAFAFMYLLDYLTR